MGRKRRKHNVGQLLREQCGINNTYSIGEAHFLVAGRRKTFSTLTQFHGPGFTTYTGTVTAASGWGGMLQKKKVVPGRKDRFQTNPISIL